MTVPDPTYCHDRVVWPVLQAVRDCTAYQLGLCARQVCYFPIVFNGGHPPFDACDCTCAEGDGQAWVRMVSVNAHYGAGSKLAGSGCGHAMLDLSFEVGLARCSPVPVDGQRYVPEDVMDEHSRGMYLDASLLRRAVLCCQLPNGNRPPKDLGATIVTESAIGPSGGCVGIELQAQVMRIECDCRNGEPR